MRHTTGTLTDEERRERRRAQKRAAMRRARARDPEKYRERNRRWREENREKHREGNRRHYAENRAEARERIRRWREANPETHWRCQALARARERAARFGREFDLTTADIPPIPRLCPYLGIELIIARGRPGGRDNSPTLDRVDPTKGYVPGNIQVISMAANSAKGDKTHQEFVEYLIRNLPKPHSFD